MVSPAVDRDLRLKMTKADGRSELLAELEKDRLAKVSFANVWLTLTFYSGAVLTFYQPPVVTMEARELAEGSAGYCDALVSLIDCEVVTSESRVGVELCLRFDSANVSVRLDGPLDDSSSHDAAVLHGVRSDLVGVWPIGEEP